MPRSSAAGLFTDRLGHVDRALRLIRDRCEIDPGCIQCAPLIYVPGLDQEKQFSAALIEIRGDRAVLGDQPERRLHDLRPGRCSGHVGNQVKADLGPEDIERLKGGKMLCVFVVPETDPG